jgi:eukaryotic-like serine/threonine-protein kinase
VLGQDNPDTLTAMQNLAAFYYWAGNHKAALAMREDVLIRRRRANGSEHPDTLLAMTALSWSYQSVDRFDEARALSEEAVTLNSRVHGPKHTLTLDAIHLLANAYDGVGRATDALELREKVLRLRQRKLGPTHRKTLGAMGNLANSYAQAGKLDDALKLWTDELEFSRKAHGLDHPETLWAMCHLAHFYTTVDRKEDALKIYEDVLPRLTKVQGLDHPDTVSATRALANSYVVAGRVPEALSLLANASAQDPADTMLAIKLAALQLWFGKEDDYGATCRRMLQWARQTGQPEIADRVAKLSCLRPTPDAEMLEAALTLARRAIELGQGNKGWFPWFQMTLGMAEYRNGRYSDADQALNAAIETLHATRRIDARIEGAVGFYRAMSLLQQGHEAEARKVFATTEEKMIPLPASEQNPLADGADHDDLILWLAYKEAKALIEPEK